MVTARLPTCQGRSFSESIMAFMTRGNVEELSIDMNDTMSTDDGYEETSSNLPGRQTQGVNRGKDVFNRFLKQNTFL